MQKNGILGVGVATMDIYVNKGRMYPGGNEYNVACNAAILGTRAGFLGVFGRDLYGPMLEGALKECGVDVSYCRYEEGTSGYSLVELKEDGDRVFLDWNRQGVTDLHPVPFTEAETDYAKSFSVVSVGRCSTVTVEKIRYLFHHGVDICYDFHAEYGNREIETFAPYTRYGFFSASHLSVEGIHETLKKAIGNGCGIAVATRGKDSVIAYDGVYWYEQPVYPVDYVLDALGAGDSYISAFLMRYTTSDETDEREKVQQALAFAARHAAHVIQIEGSIGVGYDAVIEEELRGKI